MVLIDKLGKISIFETKLALVELCTDEFKKKKKSSKESKKDKDDYMIEDEF